MITYFGFLNTFYFRIASSLGISNLDFLLNSNLKNLQIEIFIYFYQFIFILYIIIIIAEIFVQSRKSSIARTKAKLTFVKNIKSVFDIFNEAFFL